jgi:hypothetical protein
MEVLRGKALSQFAARHKVAESALSPAERWHVFTI